MPIEEAGLMAAVNSGIADAAPSAPAPTMASPTPPAPESPDVQVTGTPSVDESGDATGGAGEEDGQPPPGDVAPGTADDAAKPDGGEPGAAAPADGVEGKPPGEAEKPPVELSPEDALKQALEAPIPNALKRETKERIQTLAGKVRELMPKLEEATRDRDMMLTMVQQTGATPQQYTQALSYLALVNSSSRADREKALEIMQAEISVLARSIGKPVPGVNMLEGHADLIQEVGQGRLSMERAQEVAAAREATKLQTQGSQRITEQRTAQDDQARALNEGKAGLTALESQLRADPNYAAKRALLIPALQPVFKSVDPRQWPRLFKEAYDRMPAPVRPIPPTPTPTPAGANAGAGNTPLRAANPAGGQRAAPKSLSEAIDFGISDAH